MTQAAPRIWLDEGVLSGQCTCGAYLEQVAGTDEVLARLSLDRAHPATGDARHTDEVPAGWYRPLSGPGALSQ